MSLFTPGPNWKMSIPSRKNVRFSGKNNGNRVRLRLPRVDFGFGEVGVGRERRRDVGAETLGDIEARMELPIERCRGRRHAASRGEARAHAETASEGEVGKIGNQPRPARQGQTVPANR